MFANALRTHSRLRVLTATRIPLPATRSITSLVAFRKAVPQNVSLSVVSRSFTTSQVAREESQVAEDGTSKSPLEVPLTTSQVASEESQVAEDGAPPASLEVPFTTSQVVHEESQVAEDGAPNASLEVSQVAHEESPVAGGGAPTPPLEVPLTTSQVAGEESRFQDLAFQSQVAEVVSPKIPREAPSSTVFVANIVWSTTEDDIRKTFSKFGEITDIRLHFFQNGRPRGNCHIDFASKDSALATVMSTPISIANRRLRVEFAQGTRSKPALEPYHKLFYSNCSGDEAEIRTIFQEFNDYIVKIMPLKDPRTREPTNSGFVEFTNIATATKALVINDTQTPKGENIVVAYARPLRIRNKRNQPKPDSE